LQKKTPNLIRDSKTPNHKTQKPVERIKSLRKQAEVNKEKYRETLYKLTQEAVLVAAELSSDAKAWGEFCDANLCKEKPGRDKRKQALRYVFEAAFKRDAKTISLYVWAVEALKRKGIADEGIADALKEQGGFKKVAASGATGRKKKKTAKPSKEDRDGITRISGGSLTVLAKYLREAKALNLVETLESSKKRLASGKIVLIVDPDIDLSAIKPGVPFSIHAVIAENRWRDADLVGELRLRD